jgi:hypothetical protein
MLGTINQAQVSAMNARERLIVMGMVQDEIDKQRSLARTTALTTGTTTSTQTSSSVYTNIALTDAITLVSGYTDLYQVDITATWGDKTLMLYRTGTIEVITYMRAPHA